MNFSRSFKYCTCVFLILSECVKQLEQSRAHIRALIAINIYETSREYETKRRSEYQIKFTMYLTIAYQQILYFETFCDVREFFATKKRNVVYTCLNSQVPSPRSHGVTPTCNYKKQIFLLTMYFRYSKMKCKSSGNQKTS